MFGPTDLTMVMGRRGTGKSWLGKNWVQKCYPRKIIFDSLNEYPPDYGTPVYSWAQFSQQIIEIASSGKNKWTIVYHFDLDEEDASFELNEALRILFNMGSMLIVIEEIQFFTSPQYLSVWLKNCIYQGRHRQIAMLFTTQRPGACNKGILSQLNHFFIGAIHEKNDVDYVRSILDDKAYDLVDLPDRNFLYFQPGKQVQLVKTSKKS